MECRCEFDQEDILCAGDGPVVVAVTVTLAVVVVVVVMVVVADEVHVQDRFLISA